MHNDITAPTPIQYTDTVQRQISTFVEDNFDIKTTASKKTSKNTKSTQRSVRTDLSSWKSNLTSIPSPLEENDERKTVTPKVAFA